jgi:predicted amidophosphoribosyltransferase
MTIRLCQKCETPIEFKGRNHRYCDTCKVEVRKQSINAACKKYHQKNKILCSNCGKTLQYYRGHGQKYCKTCAENIEKENSRLRDHKYYRRWKDVLPETLGTGWLSKHPKTDFNNTDFKDEFLVVKRELKRLGLNKP